MASAGHPSVFRPSADRAINLGAATPELANAVRISASRSTLLVASAAFVPTQRRRTTRWRGPRLSTVSRWTDDVIPPINRRQWTTVASRAIAPATQASVVGGGRRRIGSITQGASRDASPGGPLPLSPNTTPGRHERRQGRGFVYPRAAGFGLRHATLRQCGFGRSCSTCSSPSRIGKRSDADPGSWTTWPQPWVPIRSSSHP